jgi:hypothetical protein
VSPFELSELSELWFERWKRFRWGTVLELVGEEYFHHFVISYASELDKIGGGLVRTRWLREETPGGLNLSEKARDGIVC